jgi:hypothetical protein
MADEANQNQVHGVVKGTGFYTPMDIAPGEAPVSATSATPPTTIGESLGFSTPMDVTPSPSSASEPTQSGNSDNADSN